MSRHVRGRDLVFHVKHVSGNIRRRGPLLRNLRQSDVGNRHRNSMLVPRMGLATSRVDV